MATATKPTAAGTKTRPAHEIRLGRIKCTLWRNETDKGPRYNCTVQRVYVDDSGQWRTTDSFGRDDLLLVAKVLDLAHTWIFENAESATNSSEGDREIPY